MIPREQLRRSANWSMAWSVAPMLILLLEIVAHIALRLILDMPRFSEWTVFLLFFPTFAGFIALMLLLEFRSPKCPACDRRLVPAQVLISSRCTNCFTVITDPQPLEEKIAGQQSTRTAYLRIAIFFLLGAIAFPAVIWCLWSRQIIVLGETRQPEFSTDFPVLLLASLLMVIFASAFLFGVWQENRKRDPKKVPPEPTCPMLRAIKGGTEFRLYFAPTMICLARIGGSFITNRAKLHRETLYGAIDPASPGLLGVDPQNLQIPRDEIADFQFLPRFKLKFHDRLRQVGCGSLTINHKQHPPLIFSIYDRLSEAEIIAVLSRWQAN